MANGPAEAAKMFRISDASIIGDGFGGPTKKGRSVPVVSGRRSGQAKRVPPPARLPRTGSDESRDYRPAPVGEIGNFTTRVYTDG
jgi:hypothetical protein